MNGKYTAIITAVVLFSMLMPALSISSGEEGAQAVREDVRGGLTSGSSDLTVNRADPDEIREVLASVTPHEKGENRVKLTPGTSPIGQDSLMSDPLRGGFRSMDPLRHCPKTRAEDDELTQNFMDYVNGSKLITPTETFNGTLDQADPMENSDFIDWYRLELTDNDPRAGTMNGLHNVSLTLNSYEVPQDAGYTGDSLYEYEVLQTGPDQYEMVNDFGDLLEVYVLYTDYWRGESYMGGTGFFYDDGDPSDGWNPSENWTYNFVTPMPSRVISDVEVYWYYIGISWNYYLKTQGTQKSPFTVEYEFTLDTSEMVDTDPQSNDWLNATLEQEDYVANIDSFYDQIDWVRLQGTDPEKLWNITFVLNRTRLSVGSTSGDTLGDNWLKLTFVYWYWGEDGTWNTADDGWLYERYTLSVFISGGGFLNAQEVSGYFKLNESGVPMDRRVVYLGLLEMPVDLEIENDEWTGRYYRTMSWRARCDYRMEIDIIEESLNRPPSIDGITCVSDYTQSEKGGNTDSEFTMNVTYSDPDNDPPEEVILWIDEESSGQEIVMNREVLEVDPDDQDYTDGKVYSIELLGMDIGDDPYPHTLSAYATDSIPIGSLRERIRSPTVWLNDTLYVWDDDPVQPNPYFPGISPMDEDDPTQEVDLMDLDGDGMFTDPEISFRGFYVWNDSLNDGEGGWDSDLDTGLVHVNISFDGFNWKARITPKPDRHGEEDLRFLGYDDHSSAEVMPHIKIIEVNDPPSVLHIDVDGTVYDAEGPDPSEPRVDLTEMTVLEDLPFSFTIVAEDGDPSGEEDPLTYTFEQMISSPWHSDIELDGMTGEVSLVPDNEDASRDQPLDLVFTVDDGRADGEITLTVVIEVTNVNDPPTIELPIVPITLEQYEDPLSITPIVEDVDRGDILTRRVNVEDALGTTGLPSISEQLPYASLVEGVDWGFNDATGEFWIKADDPMIWKTDSGMVNEVKITVRFMVSDLAGESDFADIELTLKDLNEAPPAPDMIRFEVEDEYPEVEGVQGLEVNLWVDPVEDPDLDEVTYIWDLGDGTSETGININHTYASEGTYVVKVKADDGELFSDQVSTNVKVESYTPPPPPPPKDDDGGFPILAAAIVIIVLLIIVVAVAAFFILRNRPPEEEAEEYPEGGTPGHERSLGAAPGRELPSSRARELPPTRPEKASEEKTARCPKCGAPVDPSWFLCPNCKSTL